MEKKILLASKLFIAVVFLFFFPKITNAASWYASPSGSGSTCSQASPCVLSYVIDTKVVAGDTVVLLPGSYDGGFTLNNPSKHNNLTVTTTDAVKTALGTFNRGIPSGSDNRPLVNGTITVGSGLSGVLVEYLQVRGGANPDTGDNFWGVVTVVSPNTTIQYCKITNGGAAIMVKTPAGPKTFRQNYLANASVNGTPGDTHMLYFCGSSAACGGTGAQPPTSWNEKTLVEYNTLAGSCGGDLMQFVTGSHNTETKEKYVEFSHNDFTGIADEQMIDTKGADYISIHDNNFTGSCSEGVTGSSGYYVINTTYDSGGTNQQNNNWYIYNNYFRPTAGCPGAFYNGASSSNWYVWNNIIYDSINTCFEYSGTNYLWMMATQFVQNTVIQNNHVCSSNTIGGINASGSIIKNNIFYNNNSADGDHGSITTRDGNGTVDHNFVYPTTCPSGWCTTGTNFQTSATPQVVNAAGGDFNLASTSVASYQTGTPLTDNGLFTPSIDKNGNSRVGKWSMGAIEYGTSTPDTTPPTLPSNFNLAASATSQSSITVSWNPATDDIGVTGYQVERCTGLSCTTFANVGNPTASPFVDSGLTASTGYSYHVRALDAAGNMSGWSNVVGATTQAPDTTPPSTPTSLSATATSSSTIDLTWTASTDNVSVTGYKVERCQGSSCTNFSEITNQPATNYQDTGLSASTTYRYQVRAVDAANNNSSYSSIAQATTQTPPPVSASLMLGLNFNEGTGTTTQDTSGHNNTGTLNSGATWNTTGKNGNSVTLNGTSGYITVNDANSLDLTSAMTLSAWVYPTTLSGWRTVLIKEQSGNLAYALYAHNDNNTPSQHVYVGADQQLNGTAALPTNTWSHLAATYDGTTQRLYVNGTQVSSRPQTGSILTSTGALRIGGNTVWGEYFQGRIDDLRIYNTALTQTDIQTDMNTPLTQPTSTASCNTVTTTNFSQSAYNSYGAPFDAFQTSTNLLDAKCTSSDTHTVNLTTGVTGDTTRIIYTKGYYYDPVTAGWTQYSGTCTGALNGEWCQGSVSATITNPNISTASAANPTYLVGMTCSVQGGSWKCGCRDTTCANFYWQVQGAGM